MNDEYVTPSLPLSFSSLSITDSNEKSSDILSLTNKYRRWFEKDDIMDMEWTDDFSAKTKLQYCFGSDCCCGGGTTQENNLIPQKKRKFRDIEKFFSKTSRFGVSYSRRKRPSAPSPSPNQILHLNSNSSMFGGYNGAGPGNMANVAYQNNPVPVHCNEIDELYPYFFNMDNDDVLNIEISDDQTIFIAEFLSCSEYEFLKKFLINRSTAKHIIDTLRAYKCTASSHELKQKMQSKWDAECENDTIMFIFYMTCVDTTKKLACIFGITEEEFKACIRRSCDRFLKIKSKFLQWSKQKDMNYSKIIFQQMTKLPDIIGIIGCTRILVDPPQNIGHKFFDRNGNYSIVLQTIVSGNGSFMDVFCGDYGSTHEPDILENSTIYKKVQENQELYFPRHVFIAASSKYKPLDWLMSPFRKSSRIENSRKVFNQYLESAQSNHDLAIKTLKARFPRFSAFHQETDFKLIEDVVTSFCIIHNICILLDDDIRTKFDENHLDKIVLVDSWDDSNDYECVDEDDDEMLLPVNRRREMLFRLMDDANLL